jgi:protein-L-isoaspartate(D-aspartate) O-methyltransferase
MAHFEDSYKQQGQRKQLVNELKKKGIHDAAVLEAIGKVPRHIFFDKTFHELAYKDQAFPIADGQTISHPFTVAYQTQLLHIQKGDKVLEIGTGSGYQTCVLCEVGAKVYTIERQTNLYHQTKSLLGKMGYKATFILGDGSKGWPSFAPYDKIIVTAGAPYIPPTLVNQLATGGVMIIPVGNEKTQKMVSVIKKSDGSYEQVELDDFRFVPLIGDNAW